MDGDTLSPANNTPTLETTTMATKTQTNNDLNIVNNFISNNVITPAILHTVVDMVEGDILLTFEE